MYPVPTHLLAPAPAAKAGNAKEKGKASQAVPKAGVADPPGPAEGRGARAHQAPTLPG